MKRYRIVLMSLIALLSVANGVSSADVPDHHRPQEEGIAAHPLPYREELVTFGNRAAPGVQLAGTLTLPPGSQRSPAIVLITGSGKHDRNAQIAGHELPLVLADAFTRQGYAVLRYDKRGVGQSSGNYDEATTLDFASDATAALGYLRSRSDINPAKVGLVGHSEGATIAAMIAARDPKVAYIVMMGGFALPGKILVAEQIRRMAIANGATAESVEQTYNLNRRLYAAIGASKNQADAEANVHKVLADAKPTPTQQQTDEAMMFARLPYMRFILAYDPTRPLSEVRIPVLALCGSRDLVVPPDVNLPALRKDLARDHDVTIVEIPGLNHLFQRAETGLPQEWAQIEETIAPEALSMMSDWIGRHAAHT